MKNRLKKTLIALPGFEALCRSLTTGHVRAIMYHTFSEDGSGSSIARATLQRQLDLIGAHHSTITPAEHQASLAGQSTGRCPVVITVDDGYADFHDIAFPLVEAAGMPAMLFVTTDFVAGKSWFWWDKLAFILDNVCSDEVVVAVGTDTFSLDLSTATARQSAWHRVADRCRFLSDAEKERAIDALSASVSVPLPDAPPPESQAVTWDQVRLMATRGISFGAHTVRHPILSRIDQSAARAEILESQTRLATELGEPVRWFCYPQGGPADVTPAIVKVVRENFDGAYLAYQEMREPPDCAALPRYVASPDLVGFRWMLCGAEYLFLRIKKWLGLPTGVGTEYWRGSERLENS